ncbi:hypothetical protein [Solidesulfovibrio sp.]|uniref:hypothetical protein n=1 Tax=Solidesulfovibrio sp. TaxID=2910990 RepID=UPI002B205A2C|nr:hypothetical protein [Solidesulfovibrio sp.]MEA4858223.1 hypothetical protein [Solidesulfovibrio sp.]
MTLTFLILATLLYVIYIAIRYLKTPYAQAFYPLILYCSAYILFNPAQAFDHDRHSVCARFQQQREQFVHSFCAGEMPLQAVHPKVYVPPKSLRYTAGLSHNVSIDCQDDRIIAAFPLWGYLDHSEELMYRSDGSLPEPQSQSGIQDYDKIKQNWYYVVYSKTLCRNNGARSTGTPSATKKVAPLLDLPQGKNKPGRLVGGGPVCFINTAGC